MTDTRHRNVNWQMHANAVGRLDWDSVKVAVLMDIRDELQQLNRRLNCYTVDKVAQAILRMDKRAARGSRK